VVDWIEVARKVGMVDATEAQQFFSDLAMCEDRWIVDVKASQGESGRMSGRREGAEAMSPYSWVYDPDLNLYRIPYNCLSADEHHLWCVTTTSDGKHGRQCLRRSVALIHLYVTDGVWYLHEQSCGISP
jgi:hypothetical protein